MEITTDNSLFEIALELTLVDSGAKELSPEDHARLGEVIRTKVDRCVAFIGDVESRIHRHKDYENEHKAARMHLEKSLEKFQDYVVYTMQEMGFDKLPGDEHQFSIRKSEETLVHRECSEADFNQLPEYVTKKTTYSWNKTAIKEALKSGRFPSDFAGIKINNNLNWKVK